MFRVTIHLGGFFLIGFSFFALREKLIENQSKRDCQGLSQDACAIEMVCRKISGDEWCDERFNPALDKNSVASNDEAFSPIEE
ncbi:MAG: hypothetical protein CMP10_09205 [Zetaproteobacteria bacterium]|nr:hypothetical protein [Pseudobdellovibrionaceae bacterium]